MSLRLRLALWYGGLATLVIVLLAGVVYVIHGRSLYDDVDRELANDAAHFTPIFDLVADAREEEFVARSSGQVHTFVRLYDSTGTPLVPTETGAAQPPIEVIAAEQEAAAPAYTNVLKWFPGGGVSAPGDFVTVEHTPEANRVRVYVLPIVNGGQITGYVQTWSSLDSVDRAAKRFSYLLLAMGSIGVVLVGTGGFAVSGPALRPVGAMVRTAESIARSHNFSRRVPAPAAVREDELGELARTFNQMLEALETSFTAQQRFMADAAHELRAPLTILRGNLELLDRVPDMPDEDRQVALASLHEQAKRVSRLVDELLLLARSDIGQTMREQVVELHEVVTTAVADLRALPDGARVSLDTLEPITITGDTDRLRQVITGLLDNARKYTAPDSHIHVSLEQRRGEAVITVSDEGPGIREEDLAHVFERFFRGSHARASDPGGAGLGLAIARVIIEQHQGHIEIESDPATGTTVTIRLPIETSTEAVVLPGA